MLNEEHTRLNHNIHDSIQLYDHTQHAHSHTSSLYYKCIMYSTPVYICTINSTLKIASLYSCSYY